MLSFDVNIHFEWPQAETELIREACRVSPGTIIKSMR